MIEDEFFATTRKSWRNWLEKNHDKAKGIWLVFHKGKKRTITYEEIVMEALCFGWVDSVPRKIDEEKTKLYISPRNPKSAWSSANKKRVEIIIKEQIITAAGEKVINIAKENGAWNVLDKSDALILPPDFESALKKNKKALNNYENFPNSAKRQILEWIYSAKRDETRAKRIKETIEMAARNERANDWKRT